MLLVDDILLAPLKGVFWVFKEIHKAAQAEEADEADRIRAQLCNLYMALEAAQISEAEFDAQEKKWLDRLDALELRDDDRDPPETVEQPTEVSQDSR